MIESRTTSSKVMFILKNGTGFSGVDHNNPVLFLTTLMAKVMMPTVTTVHACQIVHLASFFPHSGRPLALLCMALPAEDSP